MRITLIAVIVLMAASGLFAGDGETKLLRYPDYQNGKLVFTYMGDIWLHDGKHPARPLTAHVGADVRPKFSPDGKWIAFSSNRTGNWDVFVMPAEGGPPRQLTFYSYSDTVVTWIPDSKSVVFYTGRDALFHRHLYKVSIEGGLPERMPFAVAGTGTFSRDGRYFAFNRRSASYRRKGYRGSGDREVWLYDFKNKKLARMTKNDWHDNSPMVSEKQIYFVSEQDGTFNIWKIPVAGGEPVQVTRHKGDGVRNPSISTDGKTVVYEQGFSVCKLDVASGKYGKIDLELRTDYKQNPVTYEKFSSVVEQYSISPDGKRAAISVQGEIFTVPLDKGRIVPITDSPARDWRPVYGPKGGKIAFVSDSSGREEVYVVDSGGSGLQQVTESDTRKLEVAWSPDGKKLSVVESDHTLRIYDIESKESRILLKHKPSAPRNVRWSPDGRWIAYLKTNMNFWDDVHIVSAVDENPVEQVVVEHSPFDETGVHFTKEKIFFLADQTGEREYKLYCVPLSRQEADPDDPEAMEKLKEKKKKEAKKDGDSGKKDKKDDGKLPEVKVDLDGIEKRMKEILSVPGKMRALAVSRDSSIVVLVREPKGKKNNDTLYSVSSDGKELKRIGGGSSIRSLRFSPDGKRLFYVSGKNLYYMPKTGGSAKRVSFSVKVKTERMARYRQMFNECWRVMRDRFYDAGMHGVDWDSIREKYAAILPSVTDNEAFGYIINAMFGELNASHIGMYVSSPYATKSTFSSGHPGFEIVADRESGRYRVGHILEKGPADKEWVNLKEGDYIISIDGREVNVPDNYWKILNHPLNERVDIVVNSEPGEKEKRTSTVRLIGWWDEWWLRYREWVESNREKAAKLSNGRVTYVHIPSMGSSSLARFKRELIEFRLHEGLIIDIRYNGGGNVSQDLIDVIERRVYAREIIRNSTPQVSPYGAFPGKKIVVHNERSGSDAEYFPQAFKDLKLGKTVGVPTAGACIGTGSYRLIDGSSMRLPYVGVYMLDGTNLENYGVKPDVYVENNPDDEAAGKDAQLESAVAELMKELEEKKGDKQK